MDRRIRWPCGPQHSRRSRSASPNSLPRLHTAKRTTPPAESFSSRSPFDRRRLSLRIGQCRSVTTSPRDAALRMDFPAVRADYLLRDVAPAMVRIVDVVGGFGGQTVKHEKLLRSQLAAEGREDRACARCDGCA